PDGSNLYTPKQYDLSEQYNLLDNNKKFVTEHLVRRFIGDAKGGYNFFRQNDILADCELFKISILSKHLLSNITFEEVIRQRKKNFLYLCNALNALNRLQVGNQDDAVPGFYPFLPKKQIQKEDFWSRSIFIPVFWEDCLKRTCETDYEWELELSKRLIPIPVDHRYSEDDLNIIINLLKALTESE
ncbi:MAG TPA: hypothetical protein VF540_08295, partial [Segetibacter sp.]